MFKRLWQEPSKTLQGIIVLSVLIRLSASLYVGNEVVEFPGTFDQISYHNLALRVMDGYGFSFGELWWPATPAGEPTAHWSFLYTLYLVLVYTVINSPLVARMIQAVIVGTLMPLLVYRLSKHLFPEKDLGTKVGLFAAFGVSVYVYFFYYAVMLMTESFYITAILWSFDIALNIRRHPKTHTTTDWIWLGVAMGTAVLLRQLFLLFVPFFLLWLWWSTRPPLSRTVIPVAITILFMLPFTMRNYAAFGKVVPLNTNSGFAFFWGNHPIYGTKFTPILPDNNYYALIPEELLDLNEAELESELLTRGLGFIFDDIGRYIVLSISRIPHYFVFWPSSESSTLSNISRVGSFGVFLPFMLGGLFLSFRQLPAKWLDKLKSPFVLLYLFMLVYTGIHVLTWTLIRYRLPLDALLLIFAGYAFLQLAEKWQKQPEEAL